MRLRTDWKLILRRAWSVRFMALIGVAAGIEGGIQAWLSGISTSVWFILGIGVVSAAAIVARLAAQENLPHG